jgi:hypothetical protein
MSFLLERLRSEGDAEPGVSPTFLVRHWPGLKEWSTKAVRDAFFASPLLPRLLNPESIKETIARGVGNHTLAYVGKGKGGRYDPFLFGKSLQPDEVEISDEMFVITAEEAKKHVAPPRLTSVVITPGQTVIEPGKKQTFSSKGLDQHGREIDPGKVAWGATGGTIDAAGVFQAGKDEGNFLVTAAVGELKGTASVTIGKGTIPPLPPPPPLKGLSWEGEIPPLKWMNFYTKILAKFQGKGLKVTVRFESESKVSQQKIEETKVALRELGLNDSI